MYDFEIAVEFGWKFRYFIVRAGTEKEAYKKLWDGVLTDEEKDNVSTMEVTDVQEVDL